MKSFRFKKHHIKGSKINVIVLPEEENNYISTNGKFDSAPVPMLPKKKIPRILVNKLSKPTYRGKLEQVFHQTIE